MIDTTSLNNLDRHIRQGRFGCRSEAIETALREMLGRQSRLARVCAKLDVEQEQVMADEGLVEFARLLDPY